LGDHSLAALKKWEQREDELLAELKKIDIKPIENDPEAVTYRFLQHLLESAQGFRVCKTELWNVSPTWTGWQASLPVLAGMQSTTQPAAQQDALARWSQMPKWLDDEIANLQEGLKQGYSAPKGNVKSVIEQVDAMLAAPVKDSPFVQMAKADAPAAFRNRLEELEKTQIRPAIAKYRTFLTSRICPPRVRRLASRPTRRAGLLWRRGEVPRHGGHDGAADSRPRPCADGEDHGGNEGDRAPQLQHRRSEGPAERW
jgi:uncharacterized protein (DUF885 family)